MKIFKQLTYLLVATLLFVSCSNDDDAIDSPPVPLGDYETGFFVANEGPFGTGTGTITFVENDFSSVSQSIYNTVNSSDIGNVVNSMGFYAESAYIVANNSHLVQVVDRYTFESEATITDGLDNPRNFVAVGDKGYITNWGDAFVETDDYIAVVDLLTNTVTETIAVPLGPEKVIAVGTNVYVAHQGAFGQNNLISVIDTTTDSVTATITVGDVPNSMVLIGSDLWVLCGGAPSYATTETAGSLVKVSTATNTVSQTVSFEVTEHPSLLTSEGSDLYYTLNGGVYTMDVAATTLPTTSIISGFFYGMTAHDGKLYATDAGDYASDGTLKVYDLATQAEEQSITVGIIPGGIYFNN